MPDFVKVEGNLIGSGQSENFDHFLPTVKIRLSEAYLAICAIAPSW